MLTGDLVRPRLRIRGSSLSVEMLPVNDRYLRTASDLIGLLGDHLGKSLGTWADSLDRYEGTRTDYIIIRGLAKALADSATFRPVETSISPVEVRQRLFSQGPVFATTDLFHRRERGEVLSVIASETGLTTVQLEEALYADRPAEYVLTDIGPEWTPESLIARYNLELARGVLYWSSEMRIDIHDNFKDFWRYLKLFKLMFWAQPIDNGYHVTLDGPISPFVKSTTRYGRQFAAFLPALFLCEKWNMVADVRLQQSRETLKYQLDDKTPLKSHFKASGEFDSALEADFARAFEAKFGTERGQWLLSREDEVILLGDTVMIPDFAVTNKRDGRRALIEIVGFWHPEYLRRKVEKVRAAKRRDLILLVYEGVNLTEDRLKDVPGEVLYFPNKPVLKDVMKAVERVAKI